MPLIGTMDIERSTARAFTVDFTGMAAASHKDQQGLADAPVREFFLLRFRKPANKLIWCLE
jgi:hypothetical protein